MQCITDLIETQEVQSLEEFEQHFDINRLDHIRSVSYLSFLVCRKLGWDAYSAARGGILHDLFYYDWREKDESHRWHGYRHPRFALENAKKLCPDTLTPLEEEIILRHMWPLTPMPPKRRESFIVSMMDKYCAMHEIIVSFVPKKADKHKKAIQALKRLHKKEKV